MANQVLVVMGSDSDWPIMKNCIEILEMFAVHYEVQIASAHRTPGRALQLAKEAVNNFGVIIAGAGAAAHLPDVLAAVTPLPVIGVPIQATALQGRCFIFYGANANRGSCSYSGNRWSQKCGSAGCAYFGGQ